MRYFTGFFFFITKFSVFAVEVILTAHLSSDQPYFKCSIATCGQWLHCWTPKL